MKNLFARIGGASCGSWGILALLVGAHPAAAQPVVSFTRPTNGQQIATFSGLAGTAQTSTGAIQEATFSIHDQSTGQWWNGTNFQGASVSLPASLSGTNWVPTPGLSLPNPCCGESYQLSASATNTSAQVGTTSITVTADSVPRVVLFPSLINGQTVSSLSSIGGSVTDSFTSVASVILTIGKRTSMADQAVGGMEPNDVHLLDFTHLSGGSNGQQV